MVDAVESTLGSAAATFANGVLTVRTGEIERRWSWTSSGFATTGLTDSASGREWTCLSPGGVDDWLLPTATRTASLAERQGPEIGIYYPARTENPPATLTSVTIEPSTDDGFTSEHLLVACDIEYGSRAARRDSPAPASEVDAVAGQADEAVTQSAASARIALQFRIWVYPDSPGIRTQLLAKALPSFEPDGTRFTGRIERLPIEVDPSMSRRAIGYYNDTQNRNDTDTDILQDVLQEYPLDGPEWYRRPSAICMEDAHGGIALVKESHKCANQRGHDTGMFHIARELGLVCTGWGLLPSELREDRYREAWANWTLVWSGGDIARETAFKRFDSIRYPIDPKRDVYIIANTWGSSWNKETAQGAAAEEIVRAEIDSQADLGIDVQQIDDGWQGSGYESWSPIESRYPKGWEPVREYARGKGVKLGLWAAAMPISLEDLKRNFDEGGFLQYKLDFARLSDRDDIEALMGKVREFVRYTDHAVRVNWDVTENPPRYGYFFGREYGSLYLENRKPAWPHSAVYIPHTVLRDIWQLSKYINLHKIQCSVQNIDRVDSDLSDAPLYNHPYCVAMTLMGTPIFFQQTRLYSEGARAAIRPILAVYKEHRDQMYSGVVYPIGEKPDNRSWTGFQCVLPPGRSGGSAGYLTVFRELHNKADRHRLILRGLGSSSAATGGESSSIQLTDLLRDESHTIGVDADGGVELEIGAPADFRFYRYEVIG